MKPGKSFAETLKLALPRANRRSGAETLLTHSRSHGFGLRSKISRRRNKQNEVSLDFWSFLSRKRTSPSGDERKKQNAIPSGKQLKTRPRFCAQRFPAGVTNKMRSALTFGPFGQAKCVAFLRAKKSNKNYRKLRSNLECVRKWIIKE
ncbi:hypothetical protein BCY91_12685 [Pelobium manganitolerans]|uniref:Uncharacterized protein n=1 Tax=Pelobium manganitolerans TaxID=1842495 RepID=A0A419S1X5_9SPHI|nr:hypothetical protein BCY91_12685 [Pelobium manganitolerans]